MCESLGKSSFTVASLSGRVLIACARLPANAADLLSLVARLLQMPERSFELFYHGQKLTGERTLQHTNKMVRLTLLRSTLVATS